MGDWTSQNWTKRDGRNNQQQQQEQEKKATYKTAAELAVNNSTLSTNRLSYVSTLKKDFIRSKNIFNDQIYSK